MSSLYKFPSFDEQVLSNGVRILLLPDNEQEGLVVLHQFPFGRFADPPGKEGLTEFTLSLMQKGTTSCSSEQFSERLEHKGAVLLCDTGEEHTVLGVKMLTAFQDELIPLFFDMVFNPRFAAEEFKRIQRELLTGLRAEGVEPGIIAQRHFYVALAGRQHPAGRFHTEKTVGGIGLGDINTYYKMNIVPRGSIIAIAGKFEPSVFLQKYRPRIEQWSGTDAAMVAPAPGVPVADPIYRLVDKPDLTQATLMIGHAAPGELDQERNCIALANYILGGGNFSSRLMTRIRSRDGKTYGINSQIVALHHFGFFSISTSTQNGQIGEVIHGIVDTLRELVTGGVSGEELDKARKFAIGNLAFQLEGVGNVAEKLLWLRLYDRTESYVEQFDTMLNEITVESINRTVCRVFNPDKLSIIIVGRKTEILQQLKTIGNFSTFHFRDMV